MFHWKTNQIQSGPVNPAQLFDNQLTTLAKRLTKLDYSSSIIEKFSRSRERVLNHVSLISVAEGHIPFLPIIMPCYLGYHGLIAMVQHNNHHGVMECEADQIFNIEATPSGLYYIFDVEDGTDFYKQTPEVAHFLIRQNNRLPATAAELLSVALHTDTLSHHSLDAVGSRYKSDRTPIIWLNVVLFEAVQNSMYTTNEIEYDLSLLKSELGRPGLGWWYSSSLSRGGAVSCGSRLEI